ncbi:MAG TPA: hypothetical protein VIU46_08010 [Gallionellaceae bacterium]
MAKTLWCWRCRMEIPMLEEHEWEKVYPLLEHRIADARQDYVEHGVSLAEGEARLGYRALEAYFGLTGFRETNSNALYHHRLSLFGPICRACGKPLRTPQARHCAECGAPV